MLRPDRGRCCPHRRSQHRCSRRRISEHASSSAWCLSTLRRRRTPTRICCSPGPFARGYAVFSRPRQDNRILSQVLVTARCDVADGPGFNPTVFTTGSPSASSITAGLTEGRFRCAGPRSCPRNARPRLSSPGAARHSSRDKKVAAGRPPLRFGPSGAGRSPPVSRPPSRSRWARPEKTKGMRQWLPSAPSS